MSLINQMLQDLEKRQPGGETAGLAAARIAAVPKRRRASLFWPAILLLTAAAGGLAWQLLQTQTPVEVAAQPTKIAIAPQPVEAPAPASATEAETPVPAEETPAATQAEQVPPPPATLPAEAFMKPSTTLSPAPKPAGAPAALPKPSGSTLAAAAVEPPRRTVAPAPASPADAGNPPATDVVAKQVRKATPQQQAESEYRKALPLLQQGRVEEAIDGLAQALRLDPRHAAARQAMIGLLVEARRYGEAERRLQEGLALDPGQAELAMMLARLQVERGDVRGALSTLEHTLPHAAERPAYQAFMAALLQREERHREAIEHYQLAIRKTPSAVWLMGLGISLQAENRFQEAREAFNRARAANTLSPELLSFVEQRLRQLGQ